MKRIVGLLVVLSTMVAGVQAFAGFGFGNIVGGNDTAKVDVKSLTTREKVLRLRVGKATTALAEGLVEVQRAVGSATDAAKLEAALAEVQKQPEDMEKISQLVTRVNEASTDLKKVNMSVSMNKDEARKHLGKSLLQIGAGSLLDAQAANDAKNLVTDISNGVKAVKSSPMSYGLSAAKDLNTSLSTAKFVVDTIPNQVSTIAEIANKLIKYAQTNKIELPSEEEKVKLASNMTKE